MTAEENQRISKLEQCCMGVFSLNAGFFQNQLALAGVVIHSQARFREVLNVHEQIFKILLSGPLPDESRETLLKALKRSDIQFDQGNADLNKIVEGLNQGADQLNKIAQAFPPGMFPKITPIPPLFPPGDSSLGSPPMS